MTDRRSFLKMLFGSIAAASSAPVIAKAVLPSPMPYAGAVDLIRPYIFARDFNLGEDCSSLVLDVCPNFAMHSFSLRINQDSDMDQVSEFLDATWLDLRMGKRTYFECPIAYLTQWHLVAGMRLAIPLLVNDSLNLNLMQAREDLRFNKISGQIVAQGCRVYPEVRL